MEEVEAVINQIIELTRSEVNNRKIKASDIGVVTPYRLQCRIISRICRQRGFSDIAIGTAEVFQGQEKAVIILSTVRTGGTLGFVNSTQVRPIFFPIAFCMLQMNCCSCSRYSFNYIYEI